MSPGAIRELAHEMRRRYQEASRPEKARFWDQFAILRAIIANRRIGSCCRMALSVPRSGGGRPAVYRGGPFMLALFLLWEAAGYSCGKYFKAVIPALMASLEKKRGILYNQDSRDPLLGVSASTLGHLRKPYR